MVLIAGECYSVKYKFEYYNLIDKLRSNQTYQCFLFHQYQLKYIK